MHTNLVTMADRARLEQELLSGSPMWSVDINIQFDFLVRDITYEIGTPSL